MYTLQHKLFTAWHSLRHTAQHANKLLALVLSTVLITRQDTHLPWLGVVMLETEMLQE